MKKERNLFALLGAPLLSEILNCYLSCVFRENGQITDESALGTIG